MNKVRALYTCKRNIVSSFYLVNSLDTSSVHRICQSMFSLFANHIAFLTKANFVVGKRYESSNFDFGYQLTGQFFKKYSPEIKTTG